MNWKGLFKFMAGVFGFVVLMAIGMVAMMLVEDTKALKTPRLVQCRDLADQRDGQRVRIIAPHTDTSVECPGVSIPTQWSGTPPPSNVYEYEATWRGGSLINAQAREQ